jgi:hypothetical protein
VYSWAARVNACARLLYHTFRSTTRDIEQLLERCEGMTEEELMSDVYVDFQFDLCRACQKAYVTAPIPNSADCTGSNGV